jgi:uncharacterized damage-inducible protein DinB
MENFFSDVRSVLSTTPERWQRLAQALPGDLLERKPKQGEWSALECLSHLLDTEAVFAARMQCFLEGKDFPAFNPDVQGTKIASGSAAALATAYSQARQESLRKLDGITGADLDRTARHAELGPVTLRQMLNEWAAHDLMHTVQAEQALMQPFIADCGPWQKFFLAHWTGAPG